MMFGLRVFDTTKDSIFMLKKYYLFLLIELNVLVLTDFL
jgi:hypothetical protein